MEVILNVTYDIIIKIEKEFNVINVFFMKPSFLIFFFKTY